MQLPSELIIALSRAYALTEIIPLHHATVRDALRSVHQLLRSNDGVQASVGDSGLMIDDEALEDSQGLTREFARDLRAVGATDIRVPSDTVVEDVERLIVALRSTISGAQHDVTEGADESLDGGVMVRFKDGTTVAYKASEDERGKAARVKEPAGLARSIDRMFEVRGGAESGDDVPEDAPALPDLSDVEFPDEIEEASAPEVEEATADDSDAPAGAAEAEEGPTAVEEEAEEEPAAVNEDAEEEPAAEDEDAAESEGDQDEAAPEAAEEPEPAAIDAEAEAEEAEDGPDDGTVSFDDGPLVEQVEAFLEAGCPGPQAEEIAAAAQEAESDGKVDWVVNGVERLTRAVREERAGDDAMDLARELATPRVCSHFILRAGVVWDEMQRTELLQEMALLPEQMAPALADALTDETDRRSRRTFMEAMLSMGEWGMREVERMVDDNRWFVVRNAAAILGEIGGEEAIEHLTGILSHEDPRVRRETVLALAKIGGEDAGVLILGMLDDPDTDVRATVCRALGVLKVERAQRPLLARLEEESEEEVLEQIILALGQIGDPGAVQAIEKRAGGGFFSRPSRDIRIAAFRALGAIGTPHAMEVLRDAAGDRDEEVRNTVQAILDAR